MPTTSTKTESTAILVAPSQADILAAREAKLALEAIIGGIENKRLEAAASFAKSVTVLKIADLIGTPGTKLVDDWKTIDESTSKQLVAAGTLAKQLDVLLAAYWRIAPEDAKTAYQSLVADLQAQLSAATTGKTDLESKIDELNCEIASHQPAGARQLKAQI